MPWRRIEMKPVTTASTAAAAVPITMPSSGGTPHTFSAWALK
jgi:hypothetical protein